MCWVQKAALMGRQRRVCLCIQDLCSEIAEQRMRFYVIRVPDGCRCSKTRKASSSSSCSSPCQGSPQQIVCLHLTLSLAFSSVTPTLSMSALLHPCIFSMVSTCLAAPYSTAFVQCIQYPSSAHFFLPDKLSNPNDFEFTTKRTHMHIWEVALSEFLL